MPVTWQQVELGLADMRSRHQRAAGQLALLNQQRADKEAALAGVRQNLDIWRQVQALFEKATEAAKAHLRVRIEEVVTSALVAVFEKDISFKVEMRKIGDKSVADWMVESKEGGHTVAGDPEDSNGGGVVDVVSLALRLALLELTRPKPGGPVLLDEVGKHVSAQYAPNVAMFLRGYARRTGRQVILVTHQAALSGIADKGYHVTQIDGISKVTTTVIQPSGIAGVVSVSE